MVKTSQIKSNVLWALLRRLIVVLIVGFATNSTYPATAQTTAQPQQITVALNVGYPPFSMLLPNGEPTGLLPDMWRLWGRTTGTTVHFKTGSLTESLADLKIGRADVHAGLFRNESRAKWALFSDPIHEITTSVYFLNGGSSSPRLSKLTGERVGAVASSYQERYLNENYPDILVVGFKNNKAAVTALLNGEIRAVFTEEPSAEATVGMLGLRGALHQGEEKFDGNFVHAVVRKDRSSLLRLVNDGFRKIPREQMASLEERWLPNPGARYYSSGTGRVILSEGEKAWIKNHSEISIGVDGNWPPVDFMDSKGDHAGITADFLNIISERLGISFFVQPGPSFKDMLNKVMTGRLKVGATIIPNDERAKKITFTKPFFTIPKIVVTRKDYTEIQKPSDLAGKSIAIEKGNGVIKLLKDKYADITFITYPSSLEALKAVSFGKADAYVGSQIVADWLARKEQITNLAFVAVSGVEPSPQTFAVFNDPEWAPFVNILNKVLDSISDAERETIYQRWNRSASIMKTATSDSVELTLDERYWLSKHGRFSLGVDPAWAPFEFFNDDGQYSGIGAEFVELVSSRLGVTMTPQAGLTWSQVIDKAKAGEFDILPTVARTPEREEYLNFSNPYVSFPIVITTRKDAPFASSLDSLNGKKVGVVKGYVTQELLETNHKYIHVVPVESLVKGLQQLSDGKIDAFIDNLVTITHEIDKSKLDTIKIASPTQYKFELAMGVRKGLPELVPLINKALERISDRERTAIVNSATAIRVSYGTEMKTILMWAIPAIIAISMIIITVVLVNRRLRQDMTKLREAEHTLEQSEDRFRQLANVSSDWLWETDDDLRITHMTDGLLDLLGMKTSSLLGKSWAQLQTSKEILKPHWQQHLSDLNERREFRDFWFEMLTSDSAGIYIQLNGTPIFDKDTIFQGYRGTGTDITEKIKATHELEKAREEANHANQSKSDFLSSMSHELRTPMNAILGFAQMLDFNPKEPLTEDQKQCVDHILTGGSHLLNLINDILDFAKIEAGNVELSIEEISLAETMEEGLQTVLAMAEDRGIDISVSDTVEKAPMVRADGVRLLQVLINLLSNAIKYNRENGKVTVEVEETESGMLHVAVSDTGYGISDDKKDELFKPFSRLGAENSGIEGTGIGLVVCMDLIGRMDGFIGMDSEVGKGSTFWFELPVATDDPDASHMDAGKSEKRGEILPSAATGTLLYVEDNPANLMLMEKIIMRLDGISLISAPTGELGIELARTSKPDMIILDINLPGLSGIEVLQQLRKHDDTANTPVFALSAAATKRDIQRGVEAGFDQYLTKPVVISEIVKAIQEALENKA